MRLSHYVGNANVSLGDLHFELLRSHCQRGASRIPGDLRILNARVYE